MKADIYIRLAKHLDKLPGGYPATESGVELRILQRLFSPEDAELALHLSLIAEEPRVIAHRAKIPVSEATQRLAQMEQNRLIMAYEKEGKPTLYQAMHFVVGFWEGQVNKLDTQLVEDFEAYLPQLFDPDSWQKSPQLRTIPIGESIDTRSEVTPYTQVEALIRHHTTYSVSNCICRQEMHVLDEPCDKPLESCLGFGSAAEHIVRTGRGRAISREEVMTILKRAEETGLVVQPSNTKKASFICTCCGCCCGVLRSIKQYNKPADLVSSFFRAALDLDECTSCGVCETRCQMEAIYMDNGDVILDLDRCIGCGLCVTTCPTEALMLAPKPESEQPYVPNNIVENYIKLGQARGRIGYGELIGMQLKSKIDRLLAPK
ncbi:MAG: 4Fe-4S ferredoxin [Chloroflexi bacterium]|nr:4Fe-4S ferredoxin [Chloroflexota bacterium]